MNHLIKNYRELSENQNLLNENRFVYQDAPKPPETKTTPETATPTTQEQPMSEKDWQKHENRYSEHLKALEKANPAIAKTHKEEFKSKIEGLKKEYKQKYEEFTITIAEKVVAPKVNDLIAHISQHIKESGGQLPEMAKKDEPDTKPDKTETKDKPRQLLDNGRQTEIIKLNPGLENAKAQLVKILQEYKKSFNLKINLKNPIFDSYLNNFLNNLNKDRVKDIEQGKEFLVTEKEIKLIIDSLKKATGLDRLDDKDDKEIAILKKLRISKDGPAFDEVFSKDSKISEMLSREHEITEEDGKVKINGKEIKEIKDLKPFLTTNLQKQFDAVIGRKMKPEELKKFDNLVNIENSYLKTTNDFLKNFYQNEMKRLNPETGEKAPTIFDSIRGFLEIFTKFMNALKTGDWETATEYFQEYGKNPKEAARKIDESKKSYLNLLETNKPQDIDQILKAYLKPRGPEANALFGKEGKFRMECQDGIKTYLQKELGINKIDKISPIQDGRMQIEGWDKDGSKQIAVEFYKSGGKQLAEIKFYKDEVDANGQKKKQEKGTVVEDVKNLAQINQAIASSINKPSETTAQAPEQKDNKEAEFNNKKTQVEANLKNMIKDKNQPRLSPLGQIVKELNLPNAPQAKDFKGATQQKDLDTARVKFIVDNMTPDILAKLDKNKTYLGNTIPAPYKPGGKQIGNDLRQKMDEMRKTSKEFKKT